MPINAYFKGHGDEVMSNMTKEYGPKKGKSVFYATANKKGVKPMFTGGVVRRPEYNRPYDPNDPEQQYPGMPPSPMPQMPTESMDPTAPMAPPPMPTELSRFDAQPDDEAGSGPPPAPSPAEQAPPPSPDAIGRDPRYRNLAIQQKEMQDQAPPPMPGLRNQGTAQQQAIDYAQKILMDPKHPGQFKQPSVLQNVLGAIAPRFNMHPNLTRQYQNYELLKSRADEERKMQQAQSQEEIKRDTLATNAEARQLSAAQRQAALKPAQTITERIKEAQAAVDANGQPLYTPEEIKMIGAGWKPPAERPESHPSVAPGHGVWNPETKKYEVPVPVSDKPEKTLTHFETDDRGEVHAVAVNPSTIPAGGSVSLGRIGKSKTVPAAATPASQDDAKAIAEAIMDGKQPPDLRGLYRQGPAVKANLARQGYDLTTAQRDWTAVQKHLSTLNGQQQERLRQAISFTSDSLDNIEDLYNQWSKIGPASGFKILNRAALSASKQLPGEAGSIATNLEAQINDLTSELGTVYKGGNASTDESLRLAAENLKGDWNDPTFRRALTQIKKNLTIRRNSMLNSQAAGVSPNSPYSPPSPNAGGAQNAPGGGGTTPPLQNLMKNKEGHQIGWDGHNWVDAQTRQPVK